MITKQLAILLHTLHNLYQLIIRDATGSGSSLSSTRPSHFFKLFWGLKLEILTRNFYFFTQARARPRPVVPLLLLIGTIHSWEGKSDKQHTLQLSNVPLCIYPIYPLICCPFLLMISAVYFLKNRRAEYWRRGRLDRITSQNHQSSCQPSTVNVWSQKRRGKVHPDHWGQKCIVFLYHFTQRKSNYTALIIGGCVNISKLYRFPVGGTALIIIWVFQMF